VKSEMSSINIHHVKMCVERLRKHAQKRETRLGRRAYDDRDVRLAAFSLADMYTAEKMETSLRAKCILGGERRGPRP